MAVVSISTIITTTTTIIVVIIIMIHSIFQFQVALSRE